MLLVLFSSNCWSQQCSSQAKTELEKTLCEVKNTQYGTGLPSLHEFRKNPENMQYLLLKKPARKAGIKLPQANKSPSKPSRTAQPQNTPKHSPAAPSRPAPSKKEKPENTAALKECLLGNETIQCGNRQYRLQVNIPNHNLPKSVFSPKNQLKLPERNSAAFRQESDLFYLSKCYSLYIEKMLQLGLGDSSSSFTRFAAIYHGIGEQGGNFSSRFEEMYELLKKEKASNTVKRRYSHTEPSSMEQCMTLGDELIICDNVEKNWVYKKASR